MLLTCPMDGDKLLAYLTLNIHNPTDSIELSISYKLHIANYLSITYLIDISDIFGECEDVIILFINEAGVDDQTNFCKNGWAPLGQACVHRTSFL